MIRAFAFSVAFKKPWIGVMKRKRHESRTTCNVQLTAILGQYESLAEGYYTTVSFLASPFYFNVCCWNLNDRLHPHLYPIFSSPSMRYPEQFLRKIFPPSWHHESCISARSTEFGILLHRDTCCIAPLHLVFSQSLKILCQFNREDRPKDHPQAWHATKTCSAGWHQHSPNVYIGHSKDTSDIIM